MMDFLKNNDYRLGIGRNRDGMNEAPDQYDGLRDYGPCWERACGCRDRACPVPTSGPTAKPTTIHIILIIVIALFASCEKPDRNNPWDDEATFDQQKYAPQNLTIQANSATQITLTWDYNEIEPGGFAIARKGNDGSWTEDFATTQQKTFTDTNANLLENSYEYRVHTFYGANTSSSTEIMKIAPPTVTTQPVTDILAQSAKSGGVATEGIGLEILARGVVWSISPNPELTENKQKVDSLKTKTENDQNSSESAIKNVENQSAQRNGISDPQTPENPSSVKADEAPKEASNSGYTIDGEGAGSYESILADLEPGTQYYTRAYVKSSVGVHYGNEVAFTSGIMAPIVETGEITQITSVTALASGEVVSSGGTELSASGIVYRQSPNPMITDNLVLSDASVGTFTVQMSQLQAGITYFVRAFATNSEGTVYGEEVTFTTAAGVPTVKSIPASNILSTSAVLGGNVIHGGGLTVTGRGIAWSTMPNNPIISGNSISGGSGTGAFTVNITGLTPGNTYYYRAYATNSEGTSYGQQLSFTAGISLPSVSTNTVSNITSNSATSGGNVTSSGGATVTARGIAYGTSQNPTIAGSTVAAGSGTGSFTANMTGLQPGTTYYVRAYATNETGTSYGVQQMFITEGTFVSDVVNPITGKVWMDRNLGASRVALSWGDNESFGDLYQWGRNNDGHQKRSSFTTWTLSNNDSPGHSYFILSPNAPNDWRVPQNDNLWQGINGVNNPCPPGYRVPTAAELNEERLTWSDHDSFVITAYESPLKFTAGGGRSMHDGSISFTNGQYWSSTVSGTYADHLFFHDSNTGVGGSSRALGRTVRCIKD